MEYAALAVAALALIVALVAKSGASRMRQSVEDARTDARRRVENAHAELEGQIGTLRRLLARVAAGEKLDARMVDEGRLWREASPEEGQAMVAAGGVRILDVRTPQETARGILPGAMLIPVQTLEEHWKEIPKDGRRTLVYCAGGERSAAACEFLSRQGHENLYNLIGGIMAWSGPVEKPA